MEFTEYVRWLDHLCVLASGLRRLRKNSHYSMERMSSSIGAVLGVSGNLAHVRDIEYNFRCKTL